MNIKEMKWIRAPKQYVVGDDSVEIITEPFTDLWQRTYYHFRNDNAPALQMSTTEKFFSFVVKTELISSKCEYVICLTQRMKFSLAYMLVAPKTHRLQQSLVNLS